MFSGCFTNSVILTRYAFAVLLTSLWKGETLHSPTPAASPQLHTRPAAVQDAEIIYKLYCGAPSYFELISIPPPTPLEVERELEAATLDPKRCTELIVDEEEVIGYLDYKLDYPEAGDATVNLLLIPEHLQSLGYGRRTIALLEERLKGRAKRILASIYGQNSRAKRFWDSLGYRFAIDARPVLEWYAKEL
jgi:RimJ/RimL family protein N-acetyltransferase